MIRRWWNRIAMWLGEVLDMGGVVKLIWKLNLALALWLLSGQVARVVMGQRAGGVGRSGEEPALSVCCAMAIQKFADSGETIPQLVVAAAAKYGIPARLALRRAMEESGMRADPPPSCCIGPMQLLPSSFPGVDVRNLRINIEVGVRYLARQYRACGGDEACAVRAYRTGRVRRSAIAGPASTQREG
jgi:hypothetical protein